MSDVPLRSDLDRMVERYLTELALALQRLPMSERDHLLSEIREHIAELRAERPARDAWDMETLLNRVGLPEDIAAAALENVEDVGDEAAAPATATASAGAGSSSCGCSSAAARTATVPADPAPGGTRRSSDRARGGGECGGYPTGRRPRLQNWPVVGCPGHAAASSASADPVDGAECHRDDGRPGDSGTSGHRSFDGHVLRSLEFGARR